MQLLVLRAALNEKDLELLELREQHVALVVRPVLYIVYMTLHERMQATQYHSIHALGTVARGTVELGVCIVIQGQGYRSTRRGADL